METLVNGLSLLTRSLLIKFRLHCGLTKDLSSTLVTCLKGAICIVKLSNISIYLCSHLTLHFVKIPVFMRSFFPDTREMKAHLVERFSQHPTSVFSGVTYLLLFFVPTHLSLLQPFG